MAMAYRMPVYATVNYQQQEKWIQHYSSSQQILLVGEGDFSFSLCLAQAFGSAFNIVASSFQSYDQVIKMYKNGEWNIRKLQALGGTILCHVDATNIEGNSYLWDRKFDRIIFNFPHAGFHGSEDLPGVIQRHQNLVAEFFRSARERLRPTGEIHVTHKMKHPYYLWNLEVLASQNYLTCIERADFNIANYPGYNNKRGAYPDCDGNFPLGECCTFKFILNPFQNMQGMHHLHVQEYQLIPNYLLSPPIHPFQQHLSLIDHRNSPTSFNHMNGFYPGYNNKRGAYPDCDGNFPLGECCTFKFILNPSQNMQGMHHLHVQEYQQIPNYLLSPPIHPFQQHLSLINHRNSPTSFNHMNGFSSFSDLPLARYDLHRSEF